MNQSNQFPRPDRRFTLGCSTLNVRCSTPSSAKAAENQKSKIKNRKSSLLAFTLIELLVVIAIIAILAALIFPITGAVKRASIRSRARAELQNVQTAIEAYKTKLGYYPPASTNIPSINPLYYELMGTTYNDVTGFYTTLKGESQIRAVDVPRAFGVAITGFANSTRPGGGDEARAAVGFIRELRAGQFLTITKPGSSSPSFNILGSAVEGPLMFPGITSGKINPWCYNSSTPTNNPNSYDLWIDVLVSGKTNRICNWNSQWLVVY